MFIVVVTLGLLAAMGVYGLSATSADLKSAGHMREALQAQKAGEHALMTAAEAMNPASAATIVDAMSSPTNRTIDCRTAAGNGGVAASIAPYVSGGTAPVPPQYACKRLNETEMRLAVNQGVTPLSWPLATPAFLPDSFGAVTWKPTISVEVTNPVDVPVPPGYDPDKFRFTQVTATVFVDVRSTIDPAAAAQSVVTGRGRITIGPIQKSAAPPAF